MYKYRYLLKYLPVKENPKGLQYADNKELYQFNEGNASERIILGLTAAIEEITAKKPEEWIIAFVPAVTVERTNMRYGKLAVELEKRTGIKVSRMVIHNAGSMEFFSTWSSLGSINVDRLEVNGKRVIVIDAIITTGGSFVRIGHLLTHCGAKEVFGLFVAKTMRPDGQELESEDAVNVGMLDNVQPVKKVPKKVFISYSRSDKALVFPIMDEIERHIGPKCWIDLTGIESDQEFGDVIISAINNCDIFLFMYTKNSSKSEYARKELNFAKDKKKKIVFINVKNVEMTDWFKFYWGGHDIIDYTSSEQKEKLFNNLISWCGSVYDRGQTPVSKAFASLKNKMKLICTLAGLGVLINAVVLYLDFTNDDAKVISNSVTHNTAQLNDVVNNALVQYDQLDDVEIPDSLLSNPEVKLLNNYRENFKNYKLFLQNMRFSELEDSLTEQDRFKIHNNRCRLLNAYSTKTQNMRIIICKLSLMEEKVVKNPLLCDSMYVEQVARVDSLVIKCNEEYKALLADESLTNEQKAIRTYSRPSVIKLIECETDLFKRYYINVIIRLRQIINPPINLSDLGKIDVNEIAPVETGITGKGE